MLKNRNVQQRNQGLIRRTRSSSEFSGSSIGIPMGGPHNPNNDTNSNNASNTYGYSRGMLQRQKSNDSNTMRQLYYRANHVLNEQAQFVPPDQWKVIGGFILMILMMILMMSLDFQVDDEIDTDWINRNIIPIQMKYHHMNNSQQILCFYDGNCGYGSTCSIRKEFLQLNNNKSLFSSNVSSNNNNISIYYPGICEPIKIPFNNIVMNMLKSDKPSLKKEEDSLLSLCINTCQNELKLDESYYYNSSSTTIIWTKDNIKSIGRPIGCLLVLNRSTITNDQIVIKTTDAKNNIKEKQKQYELWMKQKTHNNNNIIRIDPLHIFSNQFHYNQFITYCYRPCIIDYDCHTLHDNNNTNTNSNTNVQTAFVCFAGVCQKNSKIWKQEETKSKPKKTKMMIGDNTIDDDTTAMINNIDTMIHNNNTDNKIIYGNNLYIISCGNYKNFLQLKQLIISVNKYAPHYKIIIYNINNDMTHEQINEAYTWDNIHSIEWINNNSPYFPTVSNNNTSGLISNNNDQMNNDNMIEIDHYIRKKAYIINETLYHYKYIIWFDPETLLHQSIYPIEEIIQRTGIFLSSSTTEGYIHPSRYIDNIIIPNALCSINVSCIIPSSPLYPLLTNNNTLYMSSSYYHYELQIPYHTEYTIKSSKIIITDDTEYQEEVVLGDDDDHIQQEQQTMTQQHQHVIWTMNQRKSKE